LLFFFFFFMAPGFHFAVIFNQHVKTVKQYWQIKMIDLLFRCVHFNASFPQWLACSHILGPGDLVRQTVSAFIDSSTWRWSLLGKEKPSQGRCRTFLQAEEWRGVLSSLPPMTWSLAPIPPEASPFLLH
jgi:hypothetical protein